MRSAVLTSPNRQQACPICGKPRLPAAAPFCSTRCADVDLHRWLQGVYAVPTDEGEGDAQGTEENSTE